MEHNMKWSDELPTEEGFYFVQFPYSEPEVLKLHNIYIYFGTKGLAFKRERWGYAHPISGYKGSCRFAGPIELPTD